MEVIEKRLLLRRSDLALFQFIIEGYGRTLTVTTEDPNAAVVKLGIVPDFLNESMEIMEALQNDFQMSWTITENEGA